MAITTCTNCGGRYTWRWEEAFEKFGFGDGDGQVETATVVAVIEDAGYEVESQQWGLHNEVITSIKRNGVEKIPSGATVGYDDPCDYLPKFRDSYRWSGELASSVPRQTSSLPFRRDGRVHPVRAPYEFYPTPPAATRALLSVERFDGSIWEPACGRGAISMVLEAAGHQVVSTDLIQRDYGVGGVDFLQQTESRAKHIVTNPPYGRGLGDAFVRHALTLTRNSGGSVTMLLNLASLSHPCRHSLWVENPPSAIYAIDELVCWPEGDPRQARASTNQHRYCWVVWKPGHQGHPTFWWLSMRDFASTAILEGLAIG